MELLDIEIKNSVVINDDDLDDKINEVNQQFLTATTLFIANMSEEKAEYITKTNEKQIQGAVAVAMGVFLLRSKQLQQQIEDAPVGTPQERAVANLQKHEKNKKKFIAKEIKKELKTKAPTRAKAITEDNVGTSEAWSRHKEAELVNDAQIVISQTTTLRVKKKWVAILDERTRTSHAQADGQVVDINQPFNVNGYNAQHPRDASLPPEETSNCRCVEEHILL
jgi:hypothetical protein